MSNVYVSDREMKIVHLGTGQVGFVKEKSNKDGRLISWWLRLVRFTTVDGRNPAPPGMYKTL